MKELIEEVHRSQPLVNGALRRQRVGHLVSNGVVFILCYPLGNLLAEQRQIRRSLALTLDAAIPFFPWMIVPYVTSGVIFILMFFLLRTQEQLRVASQRLMLATVAGCLVFLMIPARFSLERPEIDSAVLALLFQSLELVDRPYNQFPSLHVAYCVIFWSVLRPLYQGAVRTFLAVWLLLVAVSTIFTWQHHLVDVAGGLLLGTAAAFAIRLGPTRHHRITFYYSIMAGLLLLVGIGALSNWIAGYVAASLLLVATAYHAKRPGFLLKHGGRHPLRAWLLFSPYLAGYRLTWMLVRFRERASPAFAQHSSGLWIGRRLTNVEAAQLPAGCHVIDLCSELPEATSLRQQRYWHFPLLDLQAPHRGQLRQILSKLAQLHENGLPVYVHCAMGYSRSHLIARLYLRKNHRCRIRSTS